MEKKPVEASFHGIVMAFSIGRIQWSASGRCLLTWIIRISITTQQPLQAPKSWCWKWQDLHGQKAMQLRRQQWEGGVGGVCPHLGLVAPIEGKQDRHVPQFPPPLPPYCSHPQSAWLLSTWVLQSIASAFQKWGEDAGERNSAGKILTHEQCIRVMLHWAQPNEFASGN